MSKGSLLFSSTADSEEFLLAPSYGYETIEIAESHRLHFVRDLSVLTSFRLSGSAFSRKEVFLVALGSAFRLRPGATLTSS